MSGPGDYSALCGPMSRVVLCSLQACPYTPPATALSADTLAPARPYLFGASVACICLVTAGVLYTVGRWAAAKAHRSKDLAYTPGNAVSSPARKVFLFPVFPVLLYSELWPNRRGGAHGMAGPSALRKGRETESRKGPSCNAGTTSCSLAAVTT